MGEESDADLAGSWRALWDGRALYVLVDADAVRNSEQPWNDVGDTG